MISGQLVGRDSAGAEIGEVRGASESIRCRLNEMKIASPFPVPFFSMFSRGEPDPGATIHRFAVNAVVMLHSAFGHKITVDPLGNGMHAVSKELELIDCRLPDTGG